VRALQYSAIVSRRVEPRVIYNIVLRLIPLVLIYVKCLACSTTLRAVRRSCA
jgi:hypothetical protein